VSSVYIMYRSGKVYAVFDSEEIAQAEMARMKGTHDGCRIQEQAVWSNVITEELNQEDLNALRDCVAKS